MRRGRFVIGTVFAIGLVAGILGFTTFAAAGPSPQPGDEFEADGLLYSISYTAPDEVSLFGGQVQGELAVPEAVTYANREYCVTWIRGDILGDNPGLTKVILPKTVANISRPEYIDTPYFTEIEVAPDSECFSTYDGVLYSKDMTTFVFCPGGRQSITVPAAARLIPINAVSGHLYLESVHFEEGIEAIEDSAFSGCASLLDVALPATLTWLGYDVFSGCVSLQSLAVPGGVQDIPGGMLSGCTALEEVVLSEGVKRIGEHAFDRCSSLAEVELREGLVSIEHDAFIGTGVSSLNIPSTLVSFDAASFWGAETLTALTTEEENSVYTALNGVLYSADMKSLEVYLPAKTEDAYDVAPGVERIRSGAFLGAGNLVSISLPDSVVEIGAGAFDLTDSLAHVDVVAQGAAPAASDIAQQLTGSSAEGQLAGGEGLRVVDSVLYLDDEAVYLPPKNDVTHIRVPDGITKVRAAAFLHAASITSITFPASMVLFDGTIYDAGNLVDIYFLGTEPPVVTDYSVEDIATLAFGAVAPDARIHIREDGLSFEKNPIGAEGRFERFEIVEDLGSITEDRIARGRD